MLFLLPLPSHDTFWYIIFTASLKVFESKDWIDRCCHPNQCLCQEFPGPIDRLLLEVIAKTPDGHWWCWVVDIGKSFQDDRWVPKLPWIRLVNLWLWLVVSLCKRFGFSISAEKLPIAQHLEEGVMVHIFANIILSRAQRHNNQLLMLRLECHLPGDSAYVTSTSPNLRAEVLSHCVSHLLGCTSGCWQLDWRLADVKCANVKGKTPTIFIYPMLPISTLRCSSLCTDCVCALSEMYTHRHTCTWVCTCTHLAEETTYITCNDVMQTIFTSHNSESKSSVCRIHVDMQVLTMICLKQQHFGNTFFFAPTIRRNCHESWKDNTNMHAQWEKWDVPNATCLGVDCSAPAVPRRLVWIDSSQPRNITSLHTLS